MFSTCSYVFLSVMFLRWAFHARSKRCYSHSFDWKNSVCYHYFKSKSSETPPSNGYDSTVASFGRFPQDRFAKQQTLEAFSTADKHPIPVENTDTKPQNNTCKALHMFPFPDSVHQFRCADFFKPPPNETELNRAMGFERELKNLGIDDYKNMTENCTKYVLFRGYIFEPVNDEEAHFPLAFSILICRDVEQVERLLRAVYRPQNYYCIHVDKKVTGVYEPVSLIASCLPHVFMADERYQINWGEISILQAEIQCLK